MQFMRFLLILILSTTTLFSAKAAHISGGEMYYKYLGPGAGGTLRYEITLRLFRDCSAAGASVAPMPSDVTISIFDNFDDRRVSDNNVSRDYSMDEKLQKLDFACIEFAPEVCYDVSYFHFEVSLLKNLDGYTASFQTCCRVGGINNISYNFGSSNGAPGTTVSCTISGTNLLGATGVNSSPIFKLKDTALVCANNNFTLDFSANDADGDLLTYSFCDAFGSASSITNASDVASGAPVFGSFPTLTYVGAFTGFQPLGPTVSINPTTGIISGVAPATSGRFVIDVCINEWRGGVIIGSHRKDFILKIADCSVTKAVLDPQYFTCDGFTLGFSNNSSTQTGTQYFWEFGDPRSGALNFSNDPTPTHTFTDTGIYTIKLKLNINGRCEDSTTAKVKVYPGFFPALDAFSPFCKNIPVRFADATRTDYGVVNKWRWDFGNPNATNDTSLLRNPSYTYPSSGPYKVTLTVSNSFGCTSTIFKDITIVDNPPLSVFPKDTTYCGLDTLTLNAVGNGTVNWLPNTNIIDATTKTPKVYPTTTTKYYVTINDGGCIGRDSVIVRPVNNLTTNIVASTPNICDGDTLTLTANSNYTNGLSYGWTPTNKVLNPTLKSTKAFPNTNTNFTVNTRWGNNCVATATSNITVRPLAVPDAGTAAPFCQGQGQAQLQASGGTDYRWEPTTGLSNPNIANPIATPSVTTTYKVFVGVAGCTAKRVDSVNVLVRKLPPTQLTNDTLICSIDTLQLTTSGVGSFVWSPNYEISSLSNPFPKVSPDVPTTYYLTLTDGFGCISKDSVFVDVKLFVTISAGNDTTICLTDGTVINTTSDALSYKWTPNIYLSSDTAKRPIATPLIPLIKYTVVGNIGKCQSTSQVTIKTIPYPLARANRDTFICFGSTASLYATGGSKYIWSPIDFLSSTNTANTNSVKPTADIMYTVAVSDTLGCPKTVLDSVLVKVNPFIVTSTGLRDTSIVVGETLQLNGSGGNIYSWSPVAGLSNPDIKNPIAAPIEDIEYKLLVTQTPPGCTGTASVKIKVFQLPPSLYVPTAFSPNRDGTNDILRPKPLGIRSMKYFRVYNRWGQIVYETTELNKGWDGYYKGMPQDPGTYVWMAEATTFKGEVIKKKGTAVLIR
jgi:gliding motility-associated-like protein